MITHPHRQDQIVNQDVVGFAIQPNLIVRTHRLYIHLAWFQQGMHILRNVYTGGKKTKARELESIIDEIHALRFHPDNPYLISGDHFRMLYPRSLGIFYHSILDPRTARSDQDWLNRQAITLKTTAYALCAFAQASRLSTTIVPVGKYSVTLTNVFSPPSDTLYSLLYALKTLLTSEDLLRIYPFKAKKRPLLTPTSAKALLRTYKKSLQHHLYDYRTLVEDPNTGLVRTNVLLSATKDSNKRQSSFYDNVVLWRTRQLAQQLGLETVNPQELLALKERILTTFWLEQEGHFLEDLSTKCQLEKYYSSDWLIVLITGFLDPHIPRERAYFERCVAYIQRERLDIPFPLRYQSKNRRADIHFFVKLFAPSYAGKSIWGNWGMEYIKLLALLSKETRTTSYLSRAQAFLTIYAANIARYRGYPEVYTSKGKFFRTLFYKSVRRTGWIVSFEQAQAMVKSLQQAKNHT